MNSFTCVRVFHIELEFEVLVFKEREKRRKTSQCKRENQQQTQPTYVVNAGI